MTGNDPAAIELSVQEKKSAAANSVFAALGLTGIKIVVGILTGSLGILAEAAHSGLDLVAAFITYLAVRVSDRPADVAHPYGHGKIENFSALIETLLLVVTCVWIIYEAVVRIFVRHVEITPNAWAFLVVIVSIAVDISRSRMLSRTARKHHSQALEADALHFSTDVWSSAVVLAGLGLVWLGRHVLPRQAPILEKADAAAAIGVAFIVLYVSYKLGKRTVEALLDSAPDGLPEKINDAAARVDGVIKTGQVRVRRSGARVFVDMNVEVDRNLSFELTHAIAEAVEARIQAVAPAADVVVHTDPRESERETIARRVRAVADRNLIPAHNISVHDDRGQLYVDLHLEVDDHLLLHQAHELASHIEQDLRTDIPAIKEVNTHIESRGTGVGSGVDVTAQESGLAETVRRIVDGIVGRSCCHDVMVRRQGGRLAVSLHCGFDRDVPIIEAHQISTRIEETIRKEIPSVDHVIVHEEPEAH
ncbi:MAG: cation-efflux pump [Candidatus Aminicenantales bacterium]